MKKEEKRQEGRSRYRVLCYACLCALLSMVFLVVGLSAWVVNDVINEEPPPYQPTGMEICLNTTVPWHKFEEDATLLHAGIYTPYHLTPGGGEKYLLSVVQVLQTMGYTVTIYVSADNSVTNLTDLLDTAEALRVDLDGSRLALTLWPWDSHHLQVFADMTQKMRVFFALGNEKLPQVFGIGQLNIYMCQFPFDLDRPAMDYEIDNLRSYDHVLLNSEFSYKWYSHYVSPTIRELYKQGQKVPTFEVVHPAVTLLPPAPMEAASERRHIVLLGRFFKDSRVSKGHHTAIRMFAKLRPGLPPGTKLILAGQLVIGFTDYLDGLRQYIRKNGLSDSVDIFVSSPPDVILDCLHRAIVQWHLTGIEFDGKADPATLEHFGISIVEGMSAGAIPIALHGGGPSDIIQHGRTGFLAHNASEVMTYTAVIFAQSPSERTAMREAVGERSHMFSYAAFDHRFSRLVQRGFQTRLYRFFIASTLLPLRGCLVTNIAPAVARDAAPASGLVGNQPASPNPVAAKPTATIPAKLAAVLIEGRNHYALEFSILNVMGMLAGASVGPWALHLFHTVVNMPLVMAMVEQDRFANIQLHLVSRTSISGISYNRLLKMPEFWDSLGSAIEHVLIFQTDSVLLHPGIAPYLAYDYIGAPWHRQNGRWPTIARAVPWGVGSGGVSLRNASAMRTIAHAHGNVSPIGEHEDIFFVKHTLAEGGRVASRSTAALFCLEVPCNDIEAGSSTPLALHAAWYYSRDLRGFSTS